MPILGGSPLGLIGVSSGPTRDGMSTFNGGRSRNVNVNLYNAGKEADKEKLAKAKQSNKGGAFSLFTGGTFIKPWANIKTSPNNGIERLDDEGYAGVSRRTLHNNDVYDTSLLNIIEKMAGTKCSLRPTDFAYLKDIGVYPNNRLIIARRFGGPVGDDIFRGGGYPISTLITWRKPEEDFLEISFGEEWEEAKADFTDLLNKISEDLLGKKAGGSLAGGLGAIPLPGWTEALQNEVLVALKIKDAAVLNRRLPAGDPNLIKQAKRRKTVPYGEAGSGLKCSVQIKMVVEYEQKFISGIDPTVVYLDIISNALRFGTSPSVNYGLSAQFAAKLTAWVENPELIVKELVEAITTAVTNAKIAVENALKKEIEGADDGTPKPDTPEPSEKEKLEKQKGLIMRAIDKIISSITKSLKDTVAKYREEVVGIANALTGGPSTPYHVTIGNPLRPMFSAGDLYTDNVALTLGPNLAFNDLPATIKLEFTLSNARPWGLQEIKAKFNQGNLRTVNVTADATNLNPDEKLKEGNYVFNKEKVDSPVTGSPSVTTPSSGTNTGSGTGDVANKQTGAVSKDGNNQATVNTNPNSKEPVIQNDTNNTAKGQSFSTVDPNTGLSASTAGTQQQQQQSQTAKKDDPIQSANATSKRGYTYNYEIQGQTHRVVVKDKDGKFVCNTGSFDVAGAKTKEILIEDAKKAANDN